MNERLDPVLRTVATTRTDLSSIGPIRESLDQRRRAGVADIDTAGVSISEEVVSGESGAVRVRIYRGGPDSPDTTCSPIETPAASMSATPARRR